MPDQLGASTPEQEKESLGLSIDMMDVARLHSLADRLDRTVREIGTLRASVPARLSHEDACMLSRIFNRYDVIQIDQYHRINEFLKCVIAEAGDNGK